MCVLKIRWGEGKEVHLKEKMKKKKKRGSALAKVEKIKMKICEKEKTGDCTE